MQRGTFQMMKSVNKSIILNKIRTMQPISRAEIAKSTKLTPPTVGNIVKELIDQDIVIETSLGESQGGRKPTMLQINHSQFLAIGLDVGPNSLKCLLTNLSGKILSKTTTAFTDQLDEDQFINML